jgi:hypothetical protein
MDATILDSLLARARTMTQSRETDLTHRTDRRVVEGVEPAGLVAGGLAAIPRVAGGAVSMGAVSRTATISRAGTTGSSIGEVSRTDTTLGDWVVSRTVTTPLLVAAGCAGGLTTGTTAAAGGGALSIGGAGIDLATAARFMDRVSPGDRSLSNHAAPTIATAPAATAPRRTCGQMGGRSGFVPHHLHCPTVSG